MTDDDDRGGRGGVSGPPKKGDVIYERPLSLILILATNGPNGHSGQSEVSESGPK